MDSVTKYIKAEHKSSALFFMTIKEFSAAQRADNDFWMSIVSKDVLEKKTSLKSWFLSEFNCSSSSFMHFRDRVLHNSPSFNKWHNKKEQHDIATTERFGKDMPNRRSFDEWKELVHLNNEGIELLSEPQSSTSDFDCKCLLCGKEFKSKLLIGGYTWGTLRKCPYCFGNRTTLEKKIESLILTYGFTVTHETHSKFFEGTIMQGKEIDIYVPEKNIGFEINGALTHNSEFNPFKKQPKSRTFHRDKTICAKQNGVTLYHIWEHWGEDQIIDLVKSKLGIYDHKIYARNTEFRKLSWAEFAPFVKENHIHNPLPSSLLFGLFYNNELVTAISFKVAAEVAELSRLCSKRGYIVYAGLSKLLKHSISYLKDLGVKQIISYAYRDLTPFPENSAYIKAGFIFEKYTDPGLQFYKYHTKKMPSGVVLNEGVYPRHMFQKHKLMNSFGITIDQLKDFNIFKVYDSGNLKFVYTIK